MSTLVDHCVSVAHFQLNPSSYLHHKNYPLYLIENDMIVAKLVSPEYNSDDDFSFHFGPGISAKDLLASMKQLDA